MAADLKKGYYLLFVDGGKRTGAGQGQAEGAIGVVLQEPDCGAVLKQTNKRIGSVDSPQEAEYKALIFGLKLAFDQGIRYIAAFCDNVNVVNQIMDRWNKNEPAAQQCEEAKGLFERFAAWQLSWVPREMNGDADKLVQQAFASEAAGD